MTKLCGGCKKHKALDAFPYRNKQRGTRAARCKACCRESARRRRGAEVGSRKCARCEESKEATRFPWRDMNRGWRSGVCASCMEGAGEKYCRRCKRRKPRSSFNKNTARQDGLQTRCRDCDKARARDRYASNPEAQRRSVKLYQERLKQNTQQLVLEHLLEHPCVDCGESDPIKLQFDHVRGKKLGTVSKMTSQGYSLKRIKAEIAKCEVRCASCHQYRTAHQLGWWIVSALEEHNSGECPI